MKNILKTIAWINGGIAAILMLLGIIAVLAGGIFMNHMWSNYFFPSYNFILLGIFFFVATMVMKEDKV